MYNGLKKLLLKLPVDVPSVAQLFHKQTLKTRGPQSCNQGFT